MIQRLRKYSLEIGAASLLGVFAATVSYWLQNQPKDSFVRFVLSLILALCGYFLYRLLRRLWRTKWKRALRRAAEFLLTRASGFLLKFLERWHIKRERGTELGGKTTVSFDFSAFEKTEKKPQKPPKWKQLRTDRERLRYLYRGMLGGKIRRGFLAYSSETPLELQQKGEHEEAEKRLFALYTELRYDERREVPENTVQRLKEEINIK